MSTALTVDTVKQAAPKGVRNIITDDFVNKLNNLSKDPILRETFRDNALGYLSVLNEGKYKLNDYLFAIKYVSYKLMNCTNIEAYTRTFPSRYQKFIAEGVSKKDISSYVTAYSKGKLVRALLEQSAVPTWLVNADIYQDAINTQAELMRTSQSDKVRCDAANSLLTHLKRPEAAKAEISIKHEDQGSIIDDLRNATKQLREEQLKAINSGSVSLKELAHGELITNAQYTEVDKG